MQKKRLEDEKQMAERAAAECGAAGDSAGAKAKAKSRPQAPAQNEPEK